MTIIKQKHKNSCWLQLLKYEHLLVFLSFMLMFIDYFGFIDGFSINQTYATRNATQSAEYKRWKYSESQLIRTQLYIKKIK